jgi:transposase
VTHTLAKGVERPKTESGEGKIPDLADHQAREVLDAPQAESIKSKRNRAMFSTLLFHGLRAAAGSRIYLPKVGWVKCVVHREIVGKVKTVTISRNACGQFHAAIMTDNGEAMPAVSSAGKAVSIDVGLTHLAITSDGSKFTNPRHLRKAEKNLNRKQRQLSRKKNPARGQSELQACLLKFLIVRTTGSDLTPSDNW